MNAILIGGIPGSGKTSLAKLLLNDDYILIDDPRSFDNDIYPYLGNNLIITDPYFTFNKIRTIAKNELSIHNYIVFEIKLQVPVNICWQRVKDRNDSRNINYSSLEYFGG